MQIIEINTGLSECCDYVIITPNPFKLNAFTYIVYGFVTSQLLDQLKNVYLWELPHKAILS